MKDERAMKQCAACDEEFHAQENRVTDYSATEGSPVLSICEGCAEDFHRCVAKLDGDVIGQELFSKLRHYVNVERKDRGVPCVS